VLAHEVVHVLHGQLGQHANINSLLTAQWFTEGLAVYVSGMLDVDYAGVLQARLDAGFAPRTLVEVWNDGANYPLSGSIVKYIDRRYGRTALRNLLSARSTTAILTTLGVGEAELLAAWRSDAYCCATPTAILSRKCDHFGIPSTSHWTDAAIIVQGSRTKTCIVTRWRTSHGPMLSSLAE
jgi:hypothetical protein